MTTDLIAQVISLPHRQDRRDLFAADAEQQGLRYRFVEGVTGHGPIAGCVLAHKACVQRAMAAGEPRALIMEDDAFWVAPGAYRHYLEVMPETFDLYLGGVYGAGYDGPYKVRRFGGTHCYVVDQRFYQQLLDLPTTLHMDRALSAAGGDYQLCNPFVCMQRSDYSDGEQHVTTYGTWGMEKWWKGANA